MLASTVNAATIAHLYEVSVPVHSQSKKERDEAISKAFEQLLIRVTGKRDVLHLPSGQKLLKQSRKYVRSFRYEAVIPPNDLIEVFSEIEIPQDTAINLTQFSPIEELIDPIDMDETEIDAEKMAPTQKILVSFDEQAVKNSLWKHALPVWGKTRPTTLLWLAAENADQRTMLNANEKSKMKLFYCEMCHLQIMQYTYLFFSCLVVVVIDSNGEVSDAEKSENTWNSPSCHFLNHNPLSSLSSTFIFFHIIVESLSCPDLFNFIAMN